MFREQRDELICALRLANGSDVKGWFRNLSGEKMADLALRGIQQLSNWTATIHELYAWKLRHPATRYTNEEVDEENSEMYEKAVKFNYTMGEKTALIELIAMIKDVSRVLRSMQIPLASNHSSSFPRIYIYRSSQFPPFQRERGERGGGYRCNLYLYQLIAGFVFKFCNNLLVLRTMAPRASSALFFPSVCCVLTCMISS